MIYTAAQWVASGLIPTSGLLAWHMYEAAVSGHHIIYDYSGNNRTIDSPTLNAPVLTANVLYGNPGWYFDGASSTEPLNYSGSVTVNHAFVLASHEDAAFNLNRGLLTGVTSGDILASNNSGTDFFDLTLPNFAYRKSDVGYATNNQEAPMVTPELIEVIDSDGITLDGIQVGKQRNLANRVWKGYFFEQMLYNRVLTTAERRRIMLYYNLKFQQWRVGLPLYFPSADLAQVHDVDKPARFYPVPADYKKITDDWEYEDAVKDFNEVADDPPKAWEYAYTGVPKAKVMIFDEFWNQARLVNAFNFKDPDSTVWTNVRIEDYNRNHEGHKRWKHDVGFRLVGYGSVGTLE